MANNYLESSSMIEIPEEQREAAGKILEEVERELEESEEGHAGFTAELEPGGMWIYGDESINIEHTEILVCRLVDELDLKPVTVSWAYTCSKPRIDEFGGGAFVVRKGQDTIWVDAVTEAWKQAGLG